MKRLKDIIDEVKSGGIPSVDELRYAVCALDALSTFDASDLRKNRGWEESFNRWKRTLAVDPKQWVGWENDPDNPEYQKRRAAAMAFLDKVGR
jgi:hypothetical protein